MDVPYACRIKSENDYPLFVRWLHAGVAVGALFQLATSLIVLPPDEKGSAFAHTIMEVHEVGGLIVAVIVAAHFIWSMPVRAKQPSGIWVLVNPGQWREAFALIKSFPAVFTGKANMPASDNSLALIVEMFGLLVMILMAGSGMAIWIGLPETSLVVIPEETELLMDVHALIPNLLWVYVIGYVGMVWAHVRAGDPVIQRVSPFYYKPIVTNSNELMGFTKKKEQDG